MINLDDADIELLSRDNIRALYPNLARFVDQGLQFTNFHVTTPICGPSRACLMRGQYAHSTGILINEPDSHRSNGFSGGMRYYRDQGYFENDLPVWMKQQGYRTMMVGKYLHGQFLPIVPASWDDFYSTLGGNYFGAWTLTTRNNPAGEFKQLDFSTYRTEQETTDAIELIQQHGNRNNEQPFFMYLAPYAPHHNAASSNAYGMVAPVYVNSWPNFEMPTNASINEADISDKTTAIQAVFPFNSFVADELKRRNRQRALSMRSVDTMFRDIYNQVQQEGMLNNTLFILTSDNGYESGHRRFIFGKGNSYNQVSNVPFYVIGPGVNPGQANHLLAHIDIAPTLVDLAGGTAPEFVDGKSFKQLIYQPTSVQPWDWRTGILIENWESNNYFTLEFQFGSTSLRMYDRSYTEWADGTSEYFDLATDPLQLVNRIDSLDPNLKIAYSNFMRALQTKQIEPDVTISRPWDSGALVEEGQPVSGLARDEKGISRVTILVRRLSDFKFWNGATWQDGFHNFDAKLTNPGHQLTTWTFNETPGVESENEYVVLIARAFDYTGEFTQQVKFHVLRFVPPTIVSKVVVPAVGSRFPVPGIPLKIEGKVGAGMVGSLALLSIRDKDANLYWNGQFWQSEWTYVLTPVDLQRWSYEVPIHQGHFSVTAWAIDDVGNIESTPASTWFWTE
ncbi:MAG: sulfatase-like hydrolase/transferase [Planctomycetota bacterium]